jgi:prepilin signal peptidase PulO-like enzyme (type II secretory pathway)
MLMFFAIFSGLVGAVVGSFSVAQVWRLRASQLSADKKSGQKIDQKEWSRLKSLVGVRAKNDRSHCLNCGYVLRGRDLVPVFSWLALRGKCRKCHTPIGMLEFLVEILSAGIFVALFLSFGFDFSSDISGWKIARLLVLFVSMIPLIVMFVYDAKWSLLPTKTLWIFNFLAVIYFALGFFEIGWEKFDLLNFVISMLFFPGLYLALTLVSRGAWVGDGDWILAFGLILLIPNSPIFAALLLLFSNLIGIATILLAGIFQKKKIERGAQIPFGPSMILACMLMLIFMNFLKDFLIFVM